MQRKQPRCRAAAETRARQLVARSRAERTAARSLDAALCDLPDATAIAREPHRPGSAFSPRQRRAARADQLARQHRAPCDRRILRHHSQLSLRPRQHREQPRGLRAQRHHRAFTRRRRADARTCLKPRGHSAPSRLSLAPRDQRKDIMIMNRRSFSTALLAGAAASLISTRGMAANATPPNARNVVLVHGLFADGSCWSEVIARLQAVGLNATSVQNPLTTLPEAVASAERVLARQARPTVLVGHSFSGMIVTDAGVHPNVSALVHGAPRAPDAGEDYTPLAKTYPTTPATAGILFDGDEGRLSEEAFLRDFAGDLPEAKAKVLYAVQEPFHKALLIGRTTNAAWRSKPSYYAVSTEDRTINPDLERFMAKRMGAKTIEVKASHLSLISPPDEITQLILEAAGQLA